MESHPISQTVGIHTLVLRSGMSSGDFEKFMTEQAFPTAAEVPGSINRGGQSSIKSQHLLAGDGQYLWIVKGSGLGTDFSTAFNRMRDDLLSKLQAFGSVKSSTIFAVLSSFEVGQRDQQGRPQGRPQRGSDL